MNRKGRHGDAAVRLVNIKEGNIGGGVRNRVVMGQKERRQLMIKEKGKVSIFTHEEEM